MNTGAKWGAALMLAVGIGIIRSAPDSWFFLGFGICVSAVFGWLESCFKDLQDTLIAEVRKTLPRD